MASASASAKKKKAHWVVSFAAGFCSGATEVSVTMPLDTVKTFCQVNRTGMGPVAGAQQIYQLKGVQGFYFGLPAVLLQVAGKGAIRFTAFEQFKFLLQLAPVPNASVDFLAGIGAGFAEAFLWTTPTERLKVLRQNDIKSGLNRYSSLVGSVKTVATEHGITGLYAGIGATGIRQASGVGVRFALYGHVKAALTTDPPQIWQSAVAGGITGCASTLLNNPIDVIKSRIEAQDGKTKEYTGTIQAFRAILKEEGVTAFYKGIAPRLMKISIGQAITFTAYEGDLALPNFRAIATLRAQPPDGAERPATFQPKKTKVLVKGQLCGKFFGECEVSTRTVEFSIKLYDCGHFYMKQTLPGSGASPYWVIFEGRWQTTEKGIAMEYLFRYAWQIAKTRLMPDFALEAVPKDHRSRLAWCGEIPEQQLNGSVPAIVGEEPFCWIEVCREPDVVERGKARFNEEEDDIPAPAAPDATEEGPPASGAARRRAAPGGAGGSASGGADVELPG
ncbi:unnamed protein product [Effrenium voratum]|uniref:Uncharacterized protein n=1 Tax=Effrenium voratum TaxID=2562239 RepID=A0AA36NEA4_9DINO|nr:unnamed protein product [Effrenium voratum]